MISELQGLGLDIRILDDGGEEIDLNIDPDESDSSAYGSRETGMDFRSSDEEFGNAGFEVSSAEDAGGVTDNEDDMFDDDDEEYDDVDDDFDDGLDDDEIMRDAEPDDDEGDDFDNDDF